MANGFGDDFFETVLGAAKAPLEDFLTTHFHPPDFSGPPLASPGDAPVGGQQFFSMLDSPNFQPVASFFEPPSFQPAPSFGSMPMSGGFSGNFDQDWGRDFFSGLQDQISAGMQAGREKFNTRLNPPAPAGTGKPGPVSGASAPPTAPGEIEAYIRQSAAARGINPQIAVRVALSEGGVDDPVRAGDPARGGSYGPFQLNYLPGSVGTRFTEATGMHASDPKAWKAAIDFALNEASQKGWGQWFGAARAGITGFTGISTNPIQGQVSGPMEGTRAASITGGPGPSTATGTTGVGPSGSYNIGFGYGAEYTPPIRGDSGRLLTHHQGVDLVVPGAANNGRGSPVVAFESGRVTSVSRAGVAGNYVVVTDPSGREHWYMHMDGTTAKIGQEVTRGVDQLGILGGTGTEEWPHLHYEVRVNGQHTDPSPFLAPFMQAT